MIELINYIKKSNFYHKEKPLQVTDIIKTQRELVRQGCPFLPTAFIEFLKYFNGIRASDSAILGIAPLDDKSLNIVDFNVRLNASKDVAILGYDDEVFLIYDGTEDKYKLIDKHNMVVIDHFLNNELAYAINSILHL